MTDKRSTPAPVKGGNGWHLSPAPEMPFGLGERFWKAGLLLFTVILIVATLATLASGGSTVPISGLYAIPAILFAYFFRRKGVLIVYLLSLFYFGAIVWFIWPDRAEVFAAAMRSMLYIAIAFLVSYLTHHLVEERMKYHAIFDNTENGVLLLDVETSVILETNQRFAEAVRSDRRDIAGKPLSVFWTDDSSLRRFLDGLKVHCSAPTHEEPLVKADGSEWLAVIAARRISATHAVLTFIDITERKKTDRQLAALNAEANLYLDIIVHDINNINTACMGYGQMLLTCDPDAYGEITGKLRASLERSDELIRNVSVLRAIREERLGRRPIGLDEVIRKETGFFPDARITYDSTDAVVLADELLGVVFANLIGNSVKFGGKDVVVRVTAEDKGTGVLVSVEDDGPGIPDALKPTVFERFLRGDGTVSGKGLGLYICRALIEGYGGHIRVEDRVPGDPSQGAAVRFTLKRAGAD